MLVVYRGMICQLTRNICHELSIQKPLIDFIDIIIFAMHAGSVSRNDMSINKKHLHELSIQNPLSKLEK